MSEIGTLAWRRPPNAMAAVAASDLVPLLTAAPTRAARSALLRLPQSPSGDLHHRPDTTGQASNAYALTRGTHVVDLADGRTNPITPLSRRQQAS
jgi:hypothetical protein